MTDPAIDRLGFDHLIGPVGRSDFLERYYQSKPLLIHRDCPDFYQDVLSLAGVWDFVETQCPPPGEINMIKLDAGTPELDWTGAQGRADPARVAQLYGEGWTIGLNRMHEKLPALGTLCAAAESVFSFPFQTNLYLTPPGAQGFRPHWDTHDVFVLQVHGSKAWTLYDSRIDLPLSGQSFDHEKPPPGPVSDTFTMMAGDLLYCPRGLMHSAESTTEASLHITLGLMGKTWLDLMIESLSEIALKDVTLRRNLPTGYARPDFDDSAVAEEFQRVLAALTQQADLAPVLNRLREQFVSGRPKRLAGHGAQLARLDALHEQSRVRARPHLIATVETEDDSVLVNCGGSLLTLPSYTEAAIRAALNGGEFTVRDLPGPLDVDGKLTLVRRMVREGLLLIG